MLRTCFSNKMWSSWRWRPVEGQRHRFCFLRPKTNSSGSTAALGYRILHVGSSSPLLWVIHAPTSQASSVSPKDSSQSWEYIGWVGGFSGVRVVLRTLSLWVQASSGLSRSVTSILTLCLAQRKWLMNVCWKRDKRMPKPIEKFSKSLFEPESEDRPRRKIWTD